jgi:ATP-binding protein involved in chromosome partitioning
MGGGYALSCSPYVVVLRRKNDFLQWNHKEIKHKRGGSIMKVAIPSEGTEICAHFGHCESFTIAEVEDGKVINKQTVDAPPHEPGLLPRFLAGKGVNVVIAGGMGPRAQDLLIERDIQVFTGASGSIDDALEALIRGNLKTGDNVCDHGSHECNH